VGLVSRFGQFYKAVDPGLVQVNVCTESLRIVDVKIQIISIGRQTVITRDNVNVEMYVASPALNPILNRTLTPLSLFFLFRV
jgi:regulator of protease activity HflC (stomatin/prohibitin superfamily)